MRNRPFVGILILHILILFLIYSFSEKSPPAAFSEACRVNGVVEEIRSTASGFSIILSDAVIIPENKVDKSDTNISRIHCYHLLVYSKNSKALFSNLKLGNILTLQGTVCSFSKPGNSGQFNEYEYYKQLNMEYKMYAESVKITDKRVNAYKQFLYDCRVKLCRSVEKSMPENEAGIVNAVLFGEKSGLPEDIKLLYQKNGIAHLLAISGLHVTILAGGVFFILRKKVMKMQYAALATIMFLLAYGELTGFSVATSRAVVMMICMLCAKILGRSYDIISAMCLSAIIILLQKPYSFMQSGFLLSYGTVLGILLIMPALSEYVPMEQIEQWYGKMVEGIIKSILTSVAIMMMTLPILLYTYYEISIYSIFLNLLILPFMSAVVGVGAIASFSCVFSDLLGRFLFGTVYYILKYYEILCHITQRLPAAVLVIGQPQVWKILIYYLGLSVWLFFRKKGKRCIWLLLFLFVIFLPKQEYPFEVTTLDVGQGDGIFLQSNGVTMFVDGGSSSVSEVGKYRLIPFLKHRGISQIDVMCISHSDNDHVNGLLELLESKELYGISVGKVLLPWQGEPDEDYQELEKRIRKTGIIIEKMKEGDFFYCGQMKVDCYYPKTDTVVESANDYSMVLRAHYGECSVLLTGDLGMEGEKEILNMIPKTDIIKVGHHGSKNSTSEELLGRISPQIALISAGENNRYGHPSMEVLMRLKKRGIKTYITIESGAISVIGDGRKLWVSEYKK